MADYRRSAHTVDPHYAPYHLHRIATPYDSPSFVPSHVPDYGTLSHPYDRLHRPISPYDLSYVPDRLRRGSIPPYDFATTYPPPPYAPDRFRRGSIPPYDFSTTYPPPPYAPARLDRTTPYHRLRRGSIPPYDSATTYPPSPYAPARLDRTTPDHRLHRGSIPYDSSTTPYDLAAPPIHPPLGLRRGTNVSGAQLVAMYPLFAPFRSLDPYQLFPVGDNADEIREGHLRLLRPPDCVQTF